MNNFTLPPFKLKNVDTKNIKTSDYRDLFSTSYLRNTIFTLACGVYFIYGVTYYGMILFVGRLYIVDDDDHSSTCSFDYEDIFVNTIAEILGVIVSAMMLNGCQRVRTIWLLYMFAGIGMILLSIPMPLGGITFFAFISRAAIMGATVVTWVITPELFPTEVRTIAHSFAVALSRIGAFISPYLVYSSVSTTGVGIILGILNFIAVGASMQLKETGGEECVSFKHVSFSSFCFQRFAHSRFKYTPLVY